MDVIAVYKQKTIHALMDGPEKVLIVENPTAEGDLDEANRQVKLAVKELLR